MYRRRIALPVLMTFSTIVGCLTIGNPTIGAVTPTPDYQATIEAQQTTIASLTTPTPTGTPHLASPQATAVSRSLIQTAIDRDSLTGCDEIGWSVGDEYREGDDPNDHYPACLEALGLYYFAMCGDLTDAAGSFPEFSAGDTWIACRIQVTNAGTTGVALGVDDFALIAENGHRNPVALTVMNAYPSLFEGFPATTLRPNPEQYLSGWLLFVVTEPTPYLLEIAPEAGLATNSVATIIVDRLMTT